MRLREVRARGAILIDDALGQKVQHFLMPVFWFISGENMIEATIFANDDNDVFNRRSGLDGVDSFIWIGLGLGRCPKTENREGQDGRASNSLRSPFSCITAMHSFLRNIGINIAESLGSDYDRQIYTGYKLREIAGSAGQN